MAGGFASLENFRNQRRDETQAKSRFEDVQAFHDGKDVSLKILRLNLYRISVR